LKPKWLGPVMSRLGRYPFRWLPAGRPATSRSPPAFAVDPEAHFVLVHDAARALVPNQVIADVVAALRAGAAAVVPGLPVTDTIRQIAADGSSRTLDRASLRAVQTPQGFPVSVLRAAHARRDELGDLPVTDDAGLVESIGYPVTLVPGHPEALKVTTPSDLTLAAMILAARRSASTWDQARTAQVGTDE
jgi:2-C-methyl-D-erythritol 4-phosphate cytidylyltransferase